jgi:hypothetical protein
MSDTGTTALLVGLAVALARAIEWLARAVIAKPHGKANGSSGAQSPEYWKLEIGDIVERRIHEAMTGRNEEIRRIIREEIQRK